MINNLKNSLLKQKTTTSQTAAGEPEQISAKQELVENLINDHLVGGC